jgi:hypothetical protein
MKGQCELTLSPFTILSFKLFTYSTSLYPIFLPLRNHHLKQQDQYLQDFLDHHYLYL